MSATAVACRGVRAPVPEVNGYEYHLGGGRLLELLGYDHEMLCDDDAGTALARLRAAVDSGPVVAGMLDMGFLIPGLGAALLRQRAVHSCHAIRQ